MPALYLFLGNGSDLPDVYGTVLILITVIQNRSGPSGTVLILITVIQNRSGPSGTVLILKTVIQNRSEEPFLNLSLFQKKALSLVYAIY